jgi:DeoR/GlpR family transcriptional regulator of sugar metabolism
MERAPKTSGDDRPPGPRAQGEGGRVPVELRHQRIMHAFHQNGFISVTDIAAKIGVSTMTIRRDLDLLKRAGKITRTHGGAVAVRDGERVSPDVEESVFDRRLAANGGSKAAIARLAASLIEPSQAVGLDTGTTVLIAAQHLAERSDLRIVTSNLRAALALADTESRVYVLGGEVRAPELSVVGSGAVKTVQSHFLDVVLLGVSAIDENGIYDFSPEDTEVKAAFIDNASRVFVLCDSSKFDKRSLARIAPLDAIDVLVTDQPPPPRLEAALRKADVKVMAASQAAEAP